MGAMAVETLVTQRDMLLVGVLDRKMAEQASTIAGAVPIYTDMETLAIESKPDVLVELTTHESVYRHAQSAIKEGIRPVIGTSGLTPEEISHLEGLCRESGIGCIIAPNFSVGAALMMKFSAIASRFMPASEIIELHHDGKKDAPSGTAELTARMMADSKGPSGGKSTAGNGEEGSAGIPIHSVRLPGLLSHQEVLFGGEGQLLTIRHDSFSRQSYMSGIKLSVREVMKRNGLIYGLDKIIDDGQQPI